MSRVFVDTSALLALVDESTHERSLDDLLLGDARKLSLVDACSIVLMRANRIDRAFAFDAHFREEGYTL